MCFFLFNCSSIFDLNVRHAELLFLIDQPLRTESFRKKRIKIPLCLVNSVKIRRQMTFFSSKKPKKGGKGRKKDLRERERKSFICPPVFYTICLSENDERVSQISIIVNLFLERSFLQCLVINDSIVMDQKRN